jgi:hypothetical protein
MAAQRPRAQFCNRRTSSHRAAAEKARAVPPDDPARGIYYSPTGERWSRAWYDWREEGSGEASVRPFDPHDFADEVATGDGASLTGVAR